MSAEWRRVIECVHEDLPLGEMRHAMLDWAAGLTVSETSGILGRSEGAVKVMREEGLRILRRVLDAGASK